MSENQVAPEPTPVTVEPLGGEEYNPTYNPDYNPNQLPKDGCWSAECLDMPKKTNQRAYCPTCQWGIHGYLAYFHVWIIQSVWNGVISPEIPD